MRLANDLGFEPALRISAPATKYENLSEEQLKILKEFQKEQKASFKAESQKQLKILKEFQKEQKASFKAESQKRDRPQPYAASGAGGSGGGWFRQGNRH